MTVLNTVITKHHTQNTSLAATRTIHAHNHKAQTTNVTIVNEVMLTDRLKSKANSVQKTTNNSIN